MPTLLTIPLEIRDIIWNQAADRDELVICTTCIWASHEGISQLNRNLSLLLVCKQVTKEVKRHLPAYVDLKFTNWACIVRHLLNKRSLLKNIRKLSCTSRNEMESNLPCYNIPYMGSWGYIEAYRHGLEQGCNREDRLSWAGQVKCGLPRMDGLNIVLQIEINTGYH